jgi:hypothetical protein
MPWTVVNDKVSQTTIALLGHIEQRMTQVANGLTLDVAFGGHAVTLVGDFFQKTPPGNASIFTSMVDRYIRLADDQAGTVKQRNHWRECCENDTPMARGVEMFKKFTMFLVLVVVEVEYIAVHQRSSYCTNTIHCHLYGLGVEFSDLRA